MSHLSRSRLSEFLGTQLLGAGSFGAKLALFFGLVIILSAAAASGVRADEMSFSVVTIGNPAICGHHCPSIIAANGEITNRTPSEFVSFLQNNASQQGLHSIVLLNSPGGKVVASMEFGKILRRIGAAAIVARVDPGAPGAMLSGRCFSACVYALIGGKKRVIPPQSEVGIHRMFAYDGFDPSSMLGGGHRRFDDGGMAAILSRYSGMMGVSPKLIYEAEHITPDQIRILSRGEIARYHLAVTHF